MADPTLSDVAFGDIYPLSIHEHILRLQGLRRGMLRQPGRDARQNRRLDQLEREVLALSAGLAAVIELVRSKKLATDAEIERALQRSAAAAAAAATAASKVADEVANQRARARKQRAARRRS